MLEILKTAAKQYGKPVVFSGSPFEKDGALVCNVADTSGTVLGEVTLLPIPDYEGAMLDGMGNKWKGKYVVSWCHLCNTASISHHGCPGHGSSCNAGGCPDCIEDFKEFNKLKTTVEDYITEEEAKTWEKCLRLRKHIVESLQRGEKQLYWEKLAKEGHLSQNERQMFGLIGPEFEYRPGRIFAPWNETQVKGLNTWQECSFVHPFTCGNEHPEGHVNLKATEQGWVCPKCNYKQEWAHDFMLDTPKNPLAE